VTVDCSFPFEIAGGTVTGSAHVHAGRKNQDAFSWAKAGPDLVAVVCDGCSGAPYSDVGAAIAARLIVRSAAALLGTSARPDHLLERVRADVLQRLRSLAEAMSIEAHGVHGEGGPGEATRYRRTVGDYFLFTTVGFVLHDGAATTFSLGDGLVVVNGARTQIGPFEGNEPPYLGYSLLDDGRTPKTFDVGPTLPASELDSLLIGTDGVLDLEAIADRREAGEGGEGGAVAPLRQFWEEDRFFQNPDMVRRRLTMIGRGRGLLPDDTTLVVLRRAAPRDPALSADPTRGES
jgi:hypothetical protein